MAYSYEQFVGDGATRVFPINFEYLLAEHITVKVNGTAVDFEFLTPTTVQVGGAAPTPGAVVEVRRVTPVADRVVDYQDGSTLEEADLDRQTSQLLYVTQEAYDRLGTLIELTSDGTFSAQGKRISNLAPGVAPNDAVTVAQAGLPQMQQFLSLCEDARDDSQTSATNAAASASEAASSAASATVSASTAASIVASIGQETVEVVTTNRTADLADRGKVFAVSAAAGPVTITLPPIATVGEPFRLTVKKTDNTGNPVSVAASGTDTLDGGTSPLWLRVQHGGVRLASDLDPSPDNWVSQSFGLAVGDATPVGAEMWFAGTTPPPGWLVENGALLSRAVYPDLWAFVQSSGMLVTEVNWQNWSANRASFSNGDGSTTFRLPDLTTDGLFIRAQASTAPDFGRRQEDAFQNITGTLVQVPGRAGITAGSGVFAPSADITPFADAGSPGAVPASFSFDASRVARTANETRPKNAGRLPIIKAFSVPVDTKSIDVAALQLLVQSISRRKLSEVVAAASSSLVIPIPTGYRSFTLNFRDILHSAPGAGQYLQVQFSTDSGMTWASTNYVSVRGGMTSGGGSWGGVATSGGAIVLGIDYGSFGPKYGSFGDIALNLPTGGGATVRFNTSFINSAGNLVHVTGSGGWWDNGPVNAMRLIPLSGTISGSAVLYAEL